MMTECSQLCTLSYKVPVKIKQKQNQGPNIYVLSKGIPLIWAEYDSGHTHLMVVTWIETFMGNILKINLKPIGKDIGNETYLCCTSDHGTMTLSVQHKGWVGPPTGQRHHPGASHRMLNQPRAQPNKPGLLARLISSSWPLHTQLQVFKDPHFIDQGVPWTVLSCVFQCLQRVTQLFCNNELFRVQMCCCSIYWGWSFQLLQLKLRETEDHSCQHMHRLCFVMLRYLLETTAYSTLMNTLIRGAVRMSL